MEPKNPGIKLTHQKTTDRMPQAVRSERVKEYLGDEMGRIVLINVTGEDKPGLTSAITGIMAGYGVEILDIGQAVIHDALTWGILVRLPKDGDVAPVLKDLLFHLHEKGLQVTYRTVPPSEYEEWTTRQEKDRYKVTLLARAITAEQMSQVSAITAAHGLNIDNITRLSGRVPPGTKK